MNGTAFFSDCAFRAFPRTCAGRPIPLLCRVSSALNPNCRQVDEWLSAGTTASQSCLLASLPTEIFYAIIYEISSDIHDLAAFALTCKIILGAAKPYILEALKAVDAPWAGRRIICLGGCTYEDDELPAGFLTEEELNEVTTTSVPGRDSDEDPDIKFEHYFSFACETYRGISNDRRPRVMATGGRFLDRWTNTSQPTRASTRSAVGKQDFVRFVSLCGYGARMDEMYPPGEPVLFNLSKGKYVRSAPILALETTDRPLSLINALLARICWSGSPGDNAMGLDEAQHLELGRGCWAGDRFCITVMEDAPHSPDGREWVDVSEETAEFLFHLWRHARRRDPLCDVLGA